GTSTATPPPRPPPKPPGPAAAAAGGAPAAGAAPAGAAAAPRPAPGAAAPAAPAPPRPPAFMPRISGCGRSLSLLAKVTGSLADGFTSPNRMLAIAGPPPIPGNHASRMPLTLSDHGMDTGPPASATTM